MSCLYKIIIYNAFLMLYIFILLQCFQCSCKYTYNNKMLYVIAFNNMLVLSIACILHFYNVILCTCITLHQEGGR